MSDTAKLFKSGGSQAVRLPKEYRFEDQEEVLVYRQGNRIILEPKKKTWSREFLALAEPEHRSPELFILLAGILLMGFVILFIRNRYKKGSAESDGTGSGITDEESMMVSRSVNVRNLCRPVEIRISAANSSPCAPVASTTILSEG